MVLRTFSLPRSWGEAYLFVLYKGKGEESDPKNYRRITLSNVSRKLFECCLAESFRKVLESSGYFTFFSVSFSSEAKCGREPAFRRLALSGNDRF